jgi:hypothetical protein
MVPQVVSQERLNIVTPAGDKYQLLSIAQRSIVKLQAKNKGGEIS